MANTSQWALLFGEGRAVPTAVLSAGVGIHAIDVFVIAAVMPAVVGDIGGAAYYAWSAMLYMVASILGSACSAPVRARLGGRGAYTVAALAFLAGTVGCAVSPTIAALLVARVVQGGAGGLILSQSMALVREIYPTDIRTRMLAFISGVWAVAALVGPLFGGVFGQIGWWRGAFWSSVPVIVLFAAGAWRALPSDRHGATASAGTLPLLRLALLAAGVLAVGFAGNVAAPTAQAGLLVGALVLIGAAFRLDGASAERLFPSRPLTLATPTGTANWLFFLISITHSAVGVFLPLVMQVGHGISPLAAAYYNGVLALAWTAASFLASGWRGERESVALVGGSALATASVAGLAVTAARAHPLLIAALSGGIGFGVGLCNLHVTAVAMRLAARGEESIAAASIPTMRSLGIAFGAAAAGMVANGAGLAAGISPQSVLGAIPWVYGATAAAPAVATVLAARIDRLRRRAEPAATIATEAGV
ncbi:MAG: MFS transporter [Rhodospirillaceae bacterium]|nr:MFS transporter [Rhodospirillaceae bacterium]